MLICRKVARWLPFEDGLTSSEQLGCKKAQELPRNQVGAAVNRGKLLGLEALKRE